MKLPYLERALEKGNVGTLLAASATLQRRYISHKTKCFFVPFCHF